MSSKSLRAIIGLILAASFVRVTAEAQTYCLTPTAVPQPPAPPNPPPVCQPKECDKCTKSPCYVATGIYARDAVDLTMPTAGTFSLMASRLYDSSRVADGPVGIGWSSSLTARLYYATYLVSAPSIYSHEADIVLPDGVLYRFTVNSSGAFTPPFGRFDSLVRNGDGTYSLTIQHSRTVYGFNSDGSVASLTDEFGNAITWTYDGAGRLQRVADAAGSGRYIDVTWGPDGRIATLTDNISRQVKYYYDAASGTLSGVGDPTVSANASLRSTSYTYASGRFGPLLTRIADRWSRVISDLEWFPNDKLKSYTDGLYDPASITDTGEKYTYNYQSSITFKTSSVTTTGYPYDLNGIVSSQNFTNGLMTRDGNSFFEYDSAGRLTKLTAPDGVVWVYTYDATFPDKIASIIPKNQSGNALSNWAGWMYDYTQSGQPHYVWRLRSDATTKDLVVTYAYDAHGRLTVTVDDNNYTTAVYGYNQSGDLTSVTNSGGTTQIANDAVGRPISVTDGAGHITTMTYDALDRQLSVTRPRPSASATYDTVTTFSYDNYDSGTGLTFTAATDPNGRVSKVGYDAVGHMLQSVDSGGNVTQFIYQYGLLNKIRDANGNETTYGYTSAGELASTTFPDGSIERNTFTNGVLTSRVDRRGQTIRYSYDALGRLTSVTYPGLTNVYGAQVYQGYIYDGQKLTSSGEQGSNADSSHTYTYDSSWRIITDTVLNGEKKTYNYSGVTNAVFAGSLVTSYTIEPPAYTTGTTQAVSYQYGTFGRVIGETWSWLPGSPFSFEYTATGQYARFVFPNGEERRFAYDNQDRLTNITNTFPSGNTIASFDYGYDYDWQTSAYTMLGQRTSVNVTAPGIANIRSGLTKYYYDSSDQLVRADYPDNTYDGWTYDAIGSRVSKRIRNWPYPIPSTYYANAAGGNSQRLRNDSFSEFTYDAAGNVTGASAASGPNPYTWDYAGRLTSYGGKTYGYDGFERASVTSGGNTTRYISMNGNTVGERNPTTGVATDYIFGPGVDEPLAKRMANGSISYFGVDGLGSVVISTDIAGTVLSSSGYSPWGELSVLPAPELFGYTGREAGGPSWYYRARYYDSTNGRFLSEDPLRFAGGVNVYAYANNDPAQLVDPFGLSSEEPKSCDYSPDDCTSLARKIEAALKELRRLLKNERKQQATGTAFDGYDGHLEQYQNRQRQLRRLLGRFRDRNCNPALVRDDIEQWLSEEYPPPPSTFWERYKKQVAQNWDNLWRQLARGPQGPKGLPLPPFPMPAFP